MPRLQRILLSAAVSGTLLFNAGLSAQAVFTDPANLRGERVKPHDGRELSIDQGPRGLEQMLRKLNTHASMMFIVAHPDDEDGGMLTYCSRGLGARVAMLTLTRGEGGQNAMTGDFEDALGLLRTQELLAADRYLGVDQMFGTEVDFGFSKTKEEAFSKWTHERVLYDAVRAVRLYRPMVIAATFVGGVTDGHGQHQVSGEIAQEVFNAAGDPNVFPELTKEGILPWQPLKVYARVPRGAITSQGLFDYATNQFTPAKFTNYVTGEVTTTTPSVDVVVHEGKIDALLSGPNESPRSYVQFARIGLGMQKSQVGSGMRVPPSGTFDVGYHRYGSRVNKSATEEENFFAGIDTSLESIAAGGPRFLTEGFATLSESIRAMSATFSQNPSANIAPQLATADKQTINLISQVEGEELDATLKANVLHELRVKQVQLNEALALALNLRLDATTHGAGQAIGTRPVVSAELKCNAESDVSVGEQYLQNQVGTKESSGAERVDFARVSAKRPYVRTFTPSTALTASVSRPYFERSSIEEPVYRLLSPEYRNAPQAPPTLTVWETVQYRGTPVVIGRIVHDGAQPLSLLPEVNLSLRRRNEILLPGTSSVKVLVHTTAQPGVAGNVSVQSPAGWTVQPKTLTLAPEEAFTVRVPSAAAHAVTLTASANARTGALIREGYRMIGYGDLPGTPFFAPASIRFVPASFNLPTHRRVGFLPGTGDAVPESLESVGITPTMLSVADLTATKLAQFDTVILGVRTYAAHADLHGAPTQALIEFARNGGNVVLQYQTTEFMGSDAPYPLSLGDNEKVVDETAAVKLTAKDTVSVTTPNKLGDADFGGWVEERGHGFLQSWDPQYVSLTETADPGQAPQRGGWITTKLGRGHWTYCALALYRQLPEAVPGAYRILMNQLALADEK